MKGNPGKEPDLVQGARVLLIDDEPAIISALQRTLRDSGFVITAMTDPRKALDAALAEEFAVIISDNMMPELRGLDLLRQVKARYPHTRRILLTGHTGFDEAVAAFNDDAIHRFVNKPWDREQLLAYVDQELQAYWAEAREQEERDKLRKDVQLRNTALKMLITELKEARSQLAVAGGTSKAKLPVLPANVRNLAIIVVDRDDGLRRRAVGLLHRAGISNCEAFETGAEALDHLRFSPPVDVVLAEWALQEMDGVALYNRLRAGTSLSAKATFILLTTRENRRAAQYALHAGVDGFILKPFQLEPLLDQVRRAALKAEGTIGALLKELRPLSFLISNADQGYAAQIEHLLTTNGVRDVTLVRSGRAALNHCIARPTHIVISDCNIRDPYWDELRAAIAKELPPHKRPAMVVTSALPRREEFEQVFKAGLDTFYPGPPKPQHFFFTLLKAFEKRAYQNEMSTAGP